MVPLLAGLWLGLCALLVARGIAGRSRGQKYPPVLSPPEPEEPGQAWGQKPAPLSPPAPELEAPELQGPVNADAPAAKPAPSQEAPPLVEPLAPPPPASAPKAASPAGGGLKHPQRGPRADLPLPPTEREETPHPTPRLEAPAEDSPPAARAKSRGTAGGFESRPRIYTPRRPGPYVQRPRKPRDPDAPKRARSASPRKVEDAAWQLAIDVHESDPGQAFDYGIWTVDDFFRQAAAGFEALAAGYDRRIPWGRAIQVLDAREMSATLKHARRFGMHVASPKSWAASHIDVRFGLPTFCFTGVDLSRCEGRTADPKGFSKYSLIVCRQVAALPPGVFATGEGWPYEVIPMWEWDNKTKAQITLYCTISKDGKVSPARWLKLRSKVLRVRHSGTKGRIEVEVPVCAPILYALPNPDTKRDMFQDIVAISMSAWSTRETQWRVDVREPRGRITFSVHPTLIRALFATRDSHGERRKAILHWVRSHYRLNAKGQRGVRTFLRGERAFSMGGYELEISLPGYHKPMLNNESGVLVDDNNHITTDKYTHQAVCDPRLRLIARSEYNRLLREDTAQAHEITPGEPCSNVRSLSVYYQAQL